MPFQCAAGVYPARSVASAAEEDQARRTRKPMLTAQATSTKAESRRASGRGRGRRAKVTQVSTALVPRVPLIIRGPGVRTGPGGSRCRLARVELTRVEVVLVRPARAANVAAACRALKN